MLLVVAVAVVQELKKLVDLDLENNPLEWDKDPAKGAEVRPLLASLSPHSLPLSLSLSLPPP
jgi:hypothetical protein